LKLDDRCGPFQPRPFCDSVTFPFAVPQEVVASSGLRYQMLVKHPHLVSGNFVRRAPVVLGAVKLKNQ